MQGRQAAADCVVVGAGLSGLAAATRLHEAGVETLVVEARERVGGRAHTIRLEDGTPVDLGGQWRGEKHHRMARLGERHGASFHVQRVEGRRLIHSGGRAVRFRGDVPFALGPLTLGGLLAGTLRLESMARRISSDQPWTASEAQAWDGQTFETWISRHVYSRKARALLRSLFSGTLAADPADISLLHALVCMQGEGSARDLEAAIHVAQYASFTDGMGSLAERVAEALGDRIRLGHPVRRIRSRGDGVEVSAEGLSATARRMIVAIPPTLAGRIDYDPALPSVRDQLTQRMPQGSAIKCIAVYDRPFWRDAGDSGLVFDDQGPLNFCIDGTPPGVDGGVLIGFMGGRRARRAGRLAADVRRKEVLDWFGRSFGPAALSPSAYRDKDWSEEVFTRGCYSGSMPPGTWTSYGTALRAPIGPIHWAGTETARECAGLFEGALEAGERAADEVIAALSEPSTTAYASP